MSDQNQQSTPDNRDSLRWADYSIGDPNHPLNDHNRRVIEDEDAE